MGGGGGMFRAAKRVSGAGLNGLHQQDPAASATDPPPPTNKRRGGLSVSSSAAQTPTSPSPSSLSLSKRQSAHMSHHGAHLNPSFTDDFEWEYLDEAADGERGGAAVEAGGFSDELAFGSPPSLHEVEDALLSLQQAFHPALVDKDAAEHIFSPAASAKGASSTHSEVDWMEPPLQLFDWRMMQPYGLNRMYDAFHLLQTEPSIKRMVVSLSSDRAVWDAVLNNEVVRELRESLDKGEGKGPDPRISTKAHSPASTATGVLSWIFNNMKAKLMEVVANFTQLVGGLFRHHNLENKDEDDDDDDAFKEKLRASFMLTIIVLFVVVVARAI
ncbi:hypothetical protein Dimus_000488 [Dionaea muscipula]